MSLAALELFIHLDPEDAPGDLVSIEAEIPEGVQIMELRAGDLPRHWRAMPAPAALQELGRQWVETA